MARTIKDMMFSLISQGMQWGTTRKALIDELHSEQSCIECLLNYTTGLVAQPYAEKCDVIC